jgi:hypothetical protein
MHYYECMTGICMHNYSYVLVWSFYIICIDHAKIYIYSTPVSCEKSTDKIANYTGKPLIPIGIPL